MKIAREFWYECSEVENRGVNTMERWYLSELEKDGRVRVVGMDENPDLILVSSIAYSDPGKAREILNCLGENPNAKTCVICGTRYPTFDFSKRNCVMLLNKTDAILHNSAFKEKDLNKIRTATKLEIFKGADLNMFVPSETKPLELKDRNRSVSCFGAVLHCKGVYGFAENFRRYANNRYFYSSIGHLLPCGNPRGRVHVIPEFSKEMTLDIGNFNLIGGYDGKSEEFKDFLRHVRFAVFCHGTTPGYDPTAWQEAPEYCVLEAIDAGVPVIVHEDWLNSITVFGEKPDIENSGILTYGDWEDLGKERLMEYEKNYEEIVRKQRDFLQKWWGTSATRKLIDIFEEIVGEPEEHETEPELDPEMLLGGGEE